MLTCREGPRRHGADDVEVGRGLVEGARRYLVPAALGLAGQVLGLVLAGLDHGPEHGCQRTDLEAWIVDLRGRPGAAELAGVT